MKCKPPSKSAVTPETSLDAVTTQPRLLTIKQAAAYLNATVWAIRELLWSDTIPHVVIGRRHLIDRGDLDRFIDKQLSNSVRDAKNTANRIARITRQEQSGVG